MGCPRSATSYSAGAAAGSRSPEEAPVDPSPAPVDRGGPRALARRPDLALAGADRRDGPRPERQWRRSKSNGGQGFPAADDGRGRGVLPTEPGTSALAAVARAVASAPVSRDHRGHLAAVLGRPS